MSPIVDQPRPDQTDAVEVLASARNLADVPGLMADRVGRLYAEEERADRVARTERLIREAEALS